MSRAEHRRAYEELLRRYLTPLRRLASSYERDPAARDDLFQEIAMALYLWWKHRGLQPLDPAADMASYRAALLGRYDQQIALMRTVPYWYLLPLFLPGLWTGVMTWPRSPGAAVVSLVVLVSAFAFVGWLNVRVAVRAVRKAREQVATMLPDES